MDTTTIAEITDANFSEIIEGDSPVLIIFSSVNCGYCHFLKEKILKIAPQFPDLNIYECPVDKSPEAVKRFAVKSIPQFKVFQRGELIYTGLGVPREADLYYQLKPLVNANNPAYSQSEADRIYDRSP